MPVDTVWNRLRRAHALLRERLDSEHGGDRRAWLLPLAPLALARPEAPWIPLTESPPRLIQHCVSGALAMSANLKVAILLVAVASALFLMKLPVPPSAGQPPVSSSSPPAMAAQVDVGENDLAHAFFHAGFDSRHARILHRSRCRDKERV